VAGCHTKDGVIAAPGLDPGQEVPHEPVVSTLDHKGRRETLSGIATQATTPGNSIGPEVTN
jgi:hypothetical protein